MAAPAGEQLARVTKSVEMLEEQLKSLVDIATSLEPSEVKESTREVMYNLSALERDLEAAREGTGAEQRKRMESKRWKERKQLGWKQDLGKQKMETI